MKKILIPSDGSDLANYAYDLAHTIAKETGAGIEVLSVIPAPAGAVFDWEGHLKNDEGEDFSGFLEKKVVVEKQMQDWVADKPDVKSVKVKIGLIDEDIVQYVKSNNIDLLVMGTSGAEGFEEFLRGSHAQHIMRESPSPVLCLKCDRSGMLIKDILLVSDFEEVEEINLSVVKDIQMAFDATLHLLRVNTPKHFITERKVKLNMEQFAVMNALEKVTFHLYCDETIEKGLVNFSADTGIDFLAIGTHQRKGFNRLFKHSVSEDLVKHVWQPILTFPV